MGYALAYGEVDGGFIGGENFFMGNDWGKSNSDRVTQYSQYILFYTTAASVVNITAESIAERVTLKLLFIPSL